MDQLTSESVCPGNESTSYILFADAYDADDTDDAIFGACTENADCFSGESCDTGNNYCVVDQGAVMVTVDTAGFDTSVTNAIATVDETANETTRNTALGNIMAATQAQHVLDSLKIFAQTVDNSNTITTSADVPTTTYIHTERVTTGTVQVDNAVMSGTLTGVPIGNTLVVTAAGDSTPLERPANITGDLLIFDMVDSIGDEVTTGFSIDVSVAKENPGDTDIPTLVLYNESEARFEIVPGANIADGGTTWDFTLTHFSTYALQVGTAFDQAISAVTDTKAIEYLQYGKALTNDPSAPIDHERNNVIAVNGIREALKRAYVNGDSLDTIRDLSNLLLDMTSSSTLSSIAKDIRAWRLQEF